MDSLNGKSAVITGACSGIGRAIALKLAREGVNIVVSDKHSDLLAELSENLGLLDVNFLSEKCDVTKFEDCKRLIKLSNERFGSIDILVNNAGIGFSGKIAESEPEEVEQTIKVNLLGVYYLTRLVLPEMIDRQQGEIINIGSVTGLKYSPNFAMYSATKFAVRAFSEALRNEVQDDNIRVILIHPGMTNTSFFDSFTKGGFSIPKNKDEMLAPEQIAETVFFALTRPKGVAVNELTVRPTWQER